MRAGECPSCRLQLSLSLVLVDVLGHFKVACLYEIEAINARDIFNVDFLSSLEGLHRHVLEDLLNCLILQALARKDPKLTHHGHTLL